MKIKKIEVTFKKEYLEKFLQIVDERDTFISGIKRVRGMPGDEFVVTPYYEGATMTGKILVIEKNEYANGNDDYWKFEATFEDGSEGFSMSVLRFLKKTDEETWGGINRIDVEYMDDTYESAYKPDNKFWDRVGANAPEYIE